MYCIGAIDWPKYKIKDLSDCWNDCFRKIFKFQRWESVGEVQYFCHELPSDLLYDLSRWNFLSIAVQPVSVDFLRHFILDNKLHRDNFILKYGDHVSLPAMQRGIWQFLVHVLTPVKRNLFMELFVFCLFL